MNTSNNISTTIFIFIYDRSINRWIDKKYKTNLFVLCSCGRRLKIGFLDKELQNEKELFFQVYYHENKLKIIKLFIFNMKNFIMIYLMK